MADKVLLYISTGAPVVAAMLIPFAVVAMAHEAFEISYVGEVLWFLIGGLFMARVVGLIRAAHRPMR